MGQIGAHVWDGHNSAEPKCYMQPLIGWKREELVSLCNELKVLSTQTMDFAMFNALLHFDNMEDAQHAFTDLQSKCGRVDLLVVIGPLVILSDQNFISKVSLLFSVFDLNYDGCISKAELFIFLRMFFVGIKHVFFGPRLPDDLLPKLENITEQTFKRMDRDQSGEIFIGEVLSFAYRSQELRRILMPFPADDQHMFEESVIFQKPPSKTIRRTRSSSSRASVQRHVSNSYFRTNQGSFKNLSNLGKEMKERLRITPDPSSERTSHHQRVKKNFYKGPLRAQVQRPPQPSCITKENVWATWRLFLSFARGRRFIPNRELRQAFEDNSEDLMIKLKDCATMAQGAEDEHILISVASRFTTADALRRLAHNGDEQVSLRAFLCCAWPLAPEQDIEACIRWCRAFKAQEILLEILSEDLNITHLEDVDVIFEAVDIHGDGLQSAAEFCPDRHPEVHQARRLLSKWERDEDGMLHKHEVKTILQGLSTALRMEFESIYKNNPRKELQK